MFGKEELFSFSLFFFVLFWFFAGISQSRISHWLLQQGSDLSEQKKRAFYRWYQLEKTNPGKQMQPKHLLLFIYGIEAFCLLPLIFHLLVWGTPEVLPLTRLIFRGVGTNLVFALQQMMQSCLIQSCLIQACLSSYSATDTCPALPPLTKSGNQKQPLKF